MANTTVQVVLDNNLLAKVYSNAKDNGRTLSAEVRFALQEFYKNLKKWNSTGKLQPYLWYHLAYGWQLFIYLLWS